MNNDENVLSQDRVTDMLNALRPKLGAKADQYIAIMRDVFVVIGHVSNVFYSVIKNQAETWTFKIMDMDPMVDTYDNALILGATGIIGINTQYLEKEEFEKTGQIIMRVEGRESAITSGILFRNLDSIATPNSELERLHHALGVFVRKFDRALNETLREMEKKRQRTIQRPPPQVQNPSQNSMLTPEMMARSIQQGLPQYQTPSVSTHPQKPTAVMSSVPLTPLTPPPALVPTSAPPRVVPIDIGASNDSPVSITSAPRMVPIQVTDLPDVPSFDLGDDIETLIPPTKKKG